jgi:plasmid stabilization system protein ParE
MAKWTIIPVAQAELERAYAYYHEHGSERVANEFFDAALDAIGKIAENPGLWPAEDDEYRFFVLPRHSYAVVYRIEDAQNVRIVAVSHTSRAPGYWKGR